MPRPRALTPAQEAKLRPHVRAGADLPALQVHAAKLKIKASRTTLADFLKHERATGERPASVADHAQDDDPGNTPDLAAQVHALTAEVASLRGRLDGLLTLPRVKLSEVAGATVDIARQMLSDPNIDPGAKAKIMAQMPDLIDSARKALEAEQGGDADGELGV